MQLSTDEAKIIEQLKTAQTATEIAHATVKLLRACGIYNYQGVGYELARMSVTHAPE